MKSIITRKIKRPYLCTYYFKINILNSFFYHIIQFKEKYFSMYKNKLICIYYHYIK